MNKTNLSPGLQLLLFLVLMFFMILVGDLAFAMIMTVFVDPSIPVEEIDFSNPNLLLLRYFFNSTFSFIISFFLFLKFTRQKFSDIVDNNKIKGGQLLAVIGILAASLIIMELLSMVNQPLKDVLPDNPLIEYELESHQLQLDLLNHQNPLRLIISLVVMALIPAIGEELVFRGLLLKKLVESGSNKHFAVIVSGTIFAGLHLSPLQLLPMIFMGIVFGYVYVYFKNIKYPIIMHFLNNATMIVLVYFYPEMMGGGV